MNELHVHVSGMAHGGDALARHEGKVVFVPYVLPGEEVVVELTEERANYSRARLVDVLTPSPDRVEPRCLHYGTCGGCHWQHIAYARQSALREEVLRSQLKRIARLPSVQVRPTLAASDPWCYRNHVQLHLDAEGKLGFMGTDGRSVIPITECHIMHELLWDTFVGLEIDFHELERVSLRAGIATGEQLVVLESGGAQAPAIEVDVPVSCVLLLGDGTPVTYVGNSYVTEGIGDRSLRVSATSFFQANTSQTERLVRTVEQYLDPQGRECLLDIYCGVGTLGLALADSVSEVIGIDSNEAAIADAKFNAEGLTNVTFLQGSAEQVLPSIEQSVDRVILDPPRQGASKECLAALTALAAPRIVYVSCDPATLARDVGRLEQSGYQLVEVQPVDMFPQTYHVEAVALLQLGSS
jgi:23S rRNA (uracil1939-C5)-methyltransferase